MVVVVEHWSVARIMLGLGLAYTITHVRANTDTSASSCSIAPYDASARCAIDDQRPPLLCDVTHRHRGALPTFTLYSYVPTRHDNPGT
jgi:hypothetical protein